MDVSSFSFFPGSPKQNTVEEEMNASTEVYEHVVKNKHDTNFIQGNVSLLASEDISQSTHLILNVPYHQMTLSQQCEDSPGQLTPLKRTKNNGKPGGSLPLSSVVLERKSKQQRLSKETRKNFT
jgi:hypothetical protein